MELFALPLFSSASLETLRQRIDLVDVLSSSIELQRAGASYKALCPFHDEKTPSFVVQRGDRHYHCFGCGAHGDAIQFLMQYSGLSFSEAVESLAQRFGVHLERVEEGKEPSGPSRQALRKSLFDASQFYHALLLHTTEGHEALRYLYARGIDLSFIRHFRLGLAPNQGGLFQPFMRAQGHSREILEAAGLLRPQGGRDFFYGRILFPIMDATGSVIGFSGRKYQEETFGGKYVNTPETALFKKSRVLYGLHLSRRRIAKEHQAIIVEGQVDALRLIYEGFDYTVAGQGTAFGESHARELINLGVQRVYLALDGDGAGAEAAAKIGDLFQSMGVEVLLPPLPMGGDPDSFLMEAGRDAFQELLEESTDYLSFLVHHLSKESPPSTPAGKAQLVKRITKQVRKWDSPVMVHESLKRLAKLVDVPEDMIGLDKGDAPNLYIRRSGSVASVVENVDPDEVLESDLLRWVLRLGETRPEIMDLIRANIQPSAFRHAGCKSLFEAYLQACELGEARDMLALAIHCKGEDFEGVIQRILAKRVNESKAEIEIESTLRKLLERNWMREREEVRLGLQKEGLSEEETAVLLKRFGELSKSPPVIVRPVEAG
jgi:DNA primase